MKRPAWEIDVGDGPLVAAAIHDGHEVTLQSFWH